MKLRSVSFIILCLSLALGAKAQEFIPIAHVDSVNEAYTGRSYPAFQATTMDGKKLNNTSIKGKVTMFYFWFAKCATCKNDVPILNYLYSEHKADPNFRLIGISCDAKAETEAAAKQYGIQFPIATVKDLKMLRQMNLNNGLSSSVLIGKDGKIVYVKFGSVYYSKRDPNGRTNFYGKINAALNKR